MEKILTIRELIEFFEANKIRSFSAEDSGHTIHVSVPSTFEVADSNSEDGLLKVKIRLIHIGQNRNKSYISKESAEKAIPSFKNRPILAYIHQRNDGEWDFWKHNMILETNEDGNTEVVYQERQIGSITEDEPFFEYDPELKKEYLCVYGVVPIEYSKAADILLRKDGRTKNSAEIAVEKLTYDKAKKCVTFDKWTLSGTTFLGSDDDGNAIEEGMEGSNAEVIQFSDSNIEQGTKGGNASMNKFQELLEKYGKTVEDISFDYEGLSDEELEAKFEESFGAEDDSDDQSEPEAAPEPENTDDGEQEEDPTVEPEVNSEPESASEPVVANNSAENTFTFTLTLDEVSAAICRAAREFYGAENKIVWTEACVDNSVIIHETTYEENSFVGVSKHYRQRFEMSDDGAVTFIGERVEVFSEWLTKDEQNQIEEMRKNYNDVLSQLEIYQKNELWNSHEYSSIENSEEYISLKNDSNGMTFAEVKDKLETLLLNYTKKSNVAFAADKDKGATKVPLVKSGKKRQSRYGNLIKRNRDNDDE